MSLIEVGSPTVDTRNGSYVAKATVSGEEIRFESKQPLIARPEAWASAMMIPALLNQMPMVVSAPLSTVWLANIEQLQELLGRKWGLSPIAVDTSKTIDDEKVSPARANAQFFSGGVDSFYELITCADKPSALVMVHGFDIDLEDSTRFDHSKEMVEKVALCYGAEPVLVRTNVRSHRLFSSVSWEDAHGGALAAVGHVLSGKIGSIVIPPSWSSSASNALWGTHWQIDRHWSSGTLSVKHGDASLSRSERIRKIAKEPIVRDHLKVCFANLSEFGNCSRCAKCVRTMSVLHECGELEHFSVFDSIEPIWQKIDKIAFVTRSDTYLELLERGIEGKFADAIKRLIKRSQAAVIKAEYVLEHNRQLLLANQKLEEQILDLQAENERMAQSRIWKTGSFLRECKASIVSSLLKRLSADRQH